ncbi:unnamed protein product [Toxocara canis]|uniref:Uncharacterized protein n=1 Tax=Toxocara canis TaxID=6265 RepID=A0A3P7GWX5_TOXCA|nr:unnamed protein product [Toxocara canis]
MPGVDVCVFVAQTSSKVKVYTGPMLFNRFNLITKVPTQGKVSLASLALERRLCISHMPGNNDYAEHLKDGECWRYLSQDEYLLFCCCYESDHWCRYSADHSKDSIWKNNARYWPTNPELRAVYNFPFDVRNVTAKDWSYRDFVYSRPCKSNSFRYASKEHKQLQNRRKVIHEHLWQLYCWLEDTGDIQTCSVALDYGHSDESCGAMTCRMKEPNCIDNLLDTDSEYINTRVRCCCSTNNLCNHKEGSNYRLASALPRIDHYFNNSQELNFRAVVVFPLPRPQCERTYSRHIMQFGVVFCSSGFGALRQGYSCDKGYLDQMRRFANKFERPLCYEGWYKLDVRNSSGEMTKKKTTGSPLCFDEVMLIPDNMSVFVTSGTFHPYTDSLSLRLHSPSVAMVNGTIVYHIKQFSGLRNVMHNLMPMLMGFFMDDNFELLENGELKMIPRAARLPSTCKGDDEKDIGCADTSGCFEYHSFDGREPLYGCIEDIPTIVKNDPPLSTVLHCRSMLWSAEEFICDGIMDASHADGVAGVLCCCKRKCPPPINENPTSLDVGFQPFQTYK